MIETTALTKALEQFLPVQRWFGSKNRELKEVAIEKIEVMHQEWPSLIRVEAEVVLDDETVERYQVLVGLRPPGQVATFLEGNSEALMGDFETDDGPAFGYDATRDHELALKLFSRVAPNIEVPTRVRPVSTEQSNTSLIFDESYILKIFRRLPDGPNLDLEVTKALKKVEFAHVAEPLATWIEDGSDLGMLQRYLAGGSEGWNLALTSLRDFFALGGDPAEAGGDFSAEAERLGEMTAELHAALVTAFGTQPGDPEGWADLMYEQVRRTQLPAALAGHIGEAFDRLRKIRDPGPSIRVHGDYHLGQVMRTDAGWFVLDFEGEPDRFIEERRLFSSPFKDVAGMVRSFQYAAWAAMSEYDQKPIELAETWERRNRLAFLEGYVAIAHKLGGLLPSDTESLDELVAAFEMDKAVYEVGYELANRPDWVDIPVAALDRMIQGS